MRAPDDDIVDWTFPSVLRRAVIVAPRSGGTRPHGDCLLRAPKRRAFHGGPDGCMKSRSLRKHDMRLDGGKVAVMALTFGLCSSMSYIADAWRTNDSETLWLFSGVGVVLAVTLLWDLTRAPKPPRAAEGVGRTEHTAKCSR